MSKDSIHWKEVTKLTQGEPLEVERVRVKRTGIALEGRFELPALVQMPDEDQVFVSAFLRSHGSIKEMERLFGISYPTVKARLTRISESLPFVETVGLHESEDEPPKGSRSRKEILDRLAKGEINAAQATKLLRGGEAASEYAPPGGRGNKKDGR